MFDSFQIPTWLYNRFFWYKLTFKLWKYSNQYGNYQLPGIFITSPYASLPAQTIQKIYSFQRESIFLINFIFSCNNANTVVGTPTPHSATHSETLITVDAHFVTARDNTRGGNATKFNWWLQKYAAKLN